VRNAACLVTILCLTALAAGNAAVAPPQVTGVKPQTTSYGAEATTIPHMLSYQGKLTDTAGRPVPNGVYAVTFSMYSDSTGGSSFWTELQNVQVTSGLFAVLLGSVTPLDYIPEDGNCWLEMQVHPDPVMTPRIRIASAAYAYLTHKADTANYAMAGGTPEHAWTRGTPDSVLFTIRNLGIARGGAGNTLLGSHQFTHVNLGVSCTTGLAGDLVGYNTVGGGCRNVAQGHYGYSTVGGGWQNRACTTCAFVGGGYSNVVTGSYGTIAGGYHNEATMNYATVGGGYSNEASSFYAAVGGGQQNIASGLQSFVGGGRSNTATDSFTTVGAGRSNAATCYYATAAGGKHNTSDDSCTTVSGGEWNAAIGPYASVGGGTHDTASGRLATVGGGSWNAATNQGATVGGGAGNDAYGQNATVGGGLRNSAIGRSATVPGGEDNYVPADYGFATGNNSQVPVSCDNSAAFNGQTATASNQLRCGTLSKAGGSFTIDHPLDPYGKILNHYFVEGPEMRNIYDGEVTLDASGRAVVELPSYFDALNRNPRVQLTGVGTSDVFVAEKVAGNRFVIGGRPGTEVYWQVTGERKDVSAEVIRRMTPVEQPKIGALAGRMLDDDFLAGCMEQLVREGKTQGIDFRTAAGRQRYEQMKQHPSKAEQH